MLKADNPGSKSATKLGGRRSPGASISNGLTKQKSTLKSPKKSVKGDIQKSLKSQLAEYQNSHQIEAEGKEARMDKLEEELKKIKVQMKYESSIRQNSDMKTAAIESKIDNLHEQTTTCESKFDLLESRFVQLDDIIDDKIKDSQEIYDHKCLEMEENFDIIIKNSNEKMQNNILSAQNYIDEKIGSSKSDNVNQVQASMEHIIAETVNALMKTLESKLKADMQAKVSKLEKQFKFQIQDRTQELENQFKSELTLKTKELEKKTKDLAAKNKQMESMYRSQEKSAGRSETSAVGRKSSIKRDSAVLSSYLNMDRKNTEPIREMNNEDIYRDLSPVQSNDIKRRLNLSKDSASPRELGGKHVAPARTTQNKSPNMVGLNQSRDKSPNSVKAKSPSAHIANQKSNTKSPSFSRQSAKGSNVAKTADRERKSRGDRRISGNTSSTNIQQTMAVESVDIRVPNTFVNMPNTAMNSKTRQNIEFMGMVNTSVDTYTAADDINPISQQPRYILPTKKAAMSSVVPQKTFISLNVGGPQASAEPVAVSKFSKSPNKDSSAQKKFFNAGSQGTSMNRSVSGFAKRNFSVASPTRKSGPQVVLGQVKTENEADPIYENEDPIQECFNQRTKETGFEFGKIPGQSRKEFVFGIMKLSGEGLTGIKPLKNNK